MIRSPGATVVKEPAQSPLSPRERDRVREMATELPASLTPTLSRRARGSLRAPDEGTGSEGACPPFGAGADKATAAEVPLPLSATCGALFLLAKPGIVAAVALSGLTGMVLARRGLPPLSTALPCTATLLMMAAGSALINNLLDRGMDEKMERLAARTAAMKLVGTGTALLAAVVLCTTSLALAVLLLNPLAAVLLVAAACSYTLYYTLFLKRHSHWAAVLGGLPGAFPVLIGHAAVNGRPDACSLALFLVMLVWQPPHFWLLSLCHREEYERAGVPVLPLVKGETFTRLCIYAGVALLLPTALLLCLVGPCSNGYGFGAVALGLFYLAACCYFMTGIPNYRAAFRSSIIYLLLLFAMIIADLGVPLVL